MQSRVLRQSENRGNRRGSFFRLYNKSWGNQVEPTKKIKKSRAYLEEIR